MSKSASRRFRPALDGLEAREVLSALGAPGALVAKAAARRPQPITVSGNLGGSVQPDLAAGVARLTGTGTVTLLGNVNVSGVVSATSLSPGGAVSANLVLSDPSGKPLLSLAVTGRVPARVALGRAFAVSFTETNVANVPGIPASTRGAGSLVLSSFDPVSMTGTVQLRFSFRGFRV